MESINFKICADAIRRNMSYKIRLFQIKLSSDIFYI